MKFRVGLIIIFILGNVGFIRAQNAKDTRNVLDYYKILLSGDSGVMMEPDIVIKDTRNGYLKISGADAGWIEAALFRKNNDSAVLLVGENYCDGSDCSAALDAYEFVGGKAVEVTDKILPQISDEEVRAILGIDEKDRFHFSLNVEYILPRYGKTIRVFEKEFKALIAELEWRNDKFVVKKAQDIFKPLESTVNDSATPFYHCENRDVNNLKLARVKGGKNEKTYFYTVEDEEYSSGINNLDGKRIQTNKYLISGDEVLVLNINSAWACAYFRSLNGKETVGLIPLEKLAFFEADTNIDDWLGTWGHSLGNWFKIKRGNREGFVTVDGYARVEYRDLTGSETVENAFKRPVGNLITIVDEDVVFGDGCRLRLLLMGDYLVVSDNDKCTVTRDAFTGVYRRN